MQGTAAKLKVTKAYNDQEIQNKRRKKFQKSQPLEVI